METVIESQRDFMYLVDTLHSTLDNLNAFRLLMDENSDNPYEHVAMVLSPLLDAAEDNLSQISEALETFAGCRLIIKRNMAGKYVAERQEPKTA